jgi:hypothetical protein
MQLRVIPLPFVPAGDSPAFTIQILGRPPQSAESNLDMGSLAFALLREDHIIVAADRRHTRGDRTANYKNDTGLKTMAILSGSGVLGFAGHDIGEQILIPAKNDGKLDGASLRTVANELGKWAKERYRECEPNFETMLDPPSVQFLLAAFESAPEGVTATAYRLHDPGFVPEIVQFPYKKFEVIGRSTHGALYALHRFGEEADTVESGLGLSAFLLSEITECDTTIGGVPHFYVVRKGTKALRLPSAKAAQFVKWARTTGAEFGKLILKGPSTKKY